MRISGNCGKLAMITVERIVYWPSRMARKFAEVENKPYP